MRMRFDLKTGRLPGPLDHPAEARHAEGRPALAHEHERVFASLASKFAQGSEFPPSKRMRRRRAILDPTNMQERLIKVGLLPTQIDELGRTRSEPSSRPGGPADCPWTPR
jgi:hypothetical protein